MGRLEAVCVSSEGVVENLQSRITALQQSIKLLEEERDALKTSQRDSGESNSAQIRSLEKVLAVQCYDS